MTVRIITGDSATVLKTFPENHFDCVVSSPPYYGLRDYGTAKWIGGDPGCKHRSPTMRQGRNEDRAVQHGSAATNAEQLKLAARSGCGKCGATRVDSQLGLERTPGEYLERMVAIFSEVRRVLNPRGTLWLNMGDSYAGTGGQAPQTGDTFAGRSRQKDNICLSARGSGSGLKAKDLMGMPWRLAFALQADGWYLRQDIIWSKPNPMPESVRDRCTKSHEYLFLLAKSSRYHFDAEAIAEAVSESTHARMSQETIEQQQGSLKANGGVRADRPFKPVLRGVNTGVNPKAAVGAPGSKQNASFTAAISATLPTERNRRSVWTITTQAFRGAHFATFPTALVEPCILAGCPPGGKVLDPFGGAGTTGLVADRLQRDCTLIELNPEYAEMARQRLRGEAPLLSDIEVHEHR